jgi:TolA-binding protein
MLGDIAIKYWREILIILLITGVSVAWSQDHKSLIKAYDAAVNSYEEQIRELNESFQREEERKKEALRQYQEKIEEIEREYSDFRESIELQKSERVEELTGVRHSNPDRIVEEVENTFGFEYVK